MHVNVCVLKCPCLAEICFLYFEKPVCVPVFWQTCFFFFCNLTCLWSYVIWQVCLPGSSQCSFLPAMLQTGSVTTSSSERPLRSQVLKLWLDHSFTSAWIAWVNLSKRGGIFWGLAWPNLSGGFTCLGCANPLLSSLWGKCLIGGATRTFQSVHVTCRNFPIWGTPSPGYHTVVITPVD